tara:strand:+ start:2809 stop:3825 length:1017 start_codon:yes stop_codon:yes gene_type:complete
MTWFCLIYLSLLLTAEGAEPEFVGHNLPSGASISLYRTVDGKPESSAIFVRTKRDGRSLKVTPFYPLSPGEHYQARVTVDGEVIGSLDYRHPVQNTEPPVVTQILPDTDKPIPANLLKFYIEFDQPVREGSDLFDHIHLFDQSGNQVHSPWRRQELWSDDGKRLTLWIHPGRIKQGVNLREQLGPVLRPGESYTLVLDTNIRSPEGTPLAESVRHPFRTGPEIRNRIDWSKWTLKPPQKSDQPLIITSDRSLDPYLTRRHLRLFRDKDPVEVTIDWDKTQTEFTVLPKADWVVGEYQIEIDEFLEDLAGNTVLRAFDTDLLQPESAIASARLSFTFSP